MEITESKGKIGITVRIPAIVTNWHRMVAVGRTLLYGSKMADSVDITANLAAVRAEIEAAARKADRNPEEVTLVAVSASMARTASRKRKTNGRRCATTFPRPSCI